MSSVHEHFRDLSDADLLRHLELERRRGHEGSWVYNINYHLALVDEVRRREKERRAP